MHDTSEAREAIEEALKAMSDGGRKQPVIVVVDGKIDTIMLMHAIELIEQKTAHVEVIEVDTRERIPTLDALADIYIDSALEGLVDKLAYDIEAESRLLRMEGVADAQRRKGWQTCYGPAQRFRR